MGSENSVDEDGDQRDEVEEVHGIEFILFHYRLLFICWLLYLLFFIYFQETKMMMGIRVMKLWVEAVNLTIIVMLRLSPVTCQVDQMKKMKMKSIYVTTTCLSMMAHQ